MAYINKEGDVYFYLILLNLQYSKTEKQLAIDISPLLIAS